MKRGIYIKSKILITTIAALAIVGGYNFLEREGFASQSTRNISTEYTTQDLVLEFASNDVNWKDGITYDTDKYVLDVVDKYDAEVALYNRPGTNKVEYRLRLKDEADKIAYQVKTEAIEKYLERLDIMYAEMGLVDAHEQVFLEASNSMSVTKPLKMVEGEEVIETSLLEELSIDPTYYDDLIEYIELKQKLAVEEGRINEVGSIYFYRDVTVTAPYEYDDLYLTIGSEYNLLDGITYDKDMYDITIENESSFCEDITGLYFIEYKITHKDGGVLYFDRCVYLIEEPLESNEEEHITTMNSIETYATVVPSNNVIKTNGSYSYRKDSPNSYTSTYITISEGVKNVTLYLSGSGYLGGVALPDSMESLTIWVEEGTNFTFVGSGYSMVSTTVRKSAIHGGENAKIFILGDGVLNIKGNSASNGASTAWDGTNASIGIGVGGVGASAAINKKTSISIYSTNNNIFITGGSGGSGADGGNSGGQLRSSGYSVSSGSGGGGGGYVAMAVGDNADDGEDGGKNSVDGAGTNFYIETDVKGGDGGEGSVGGGGGAGADFFRNYLETSYVIHYFDRGGASGLVSYWAASVSNGSDGLTGRSYKNSLSGSSYSGFAGGTGGKSIGYAQDIPTVYPVVYHYNGSELANPIGSTGALDRRDTGSDSIYVLPYIKDSIFYGFTASEEDAEEGLTNVMDVIADDASKIGVSYNPAPPVDLEAYFIDPLGITSSFIWYDPDYEGRRLGTTGYQIPDGYQIKGYNVRAYISDPDMETSPQVTYYTVDQVKTDTKGRLGLPESKALDNVSFWSVSLMISNGSNTLESPTTIIQVESPVISVTRADDLEHGGAFMNLASALDYIVDDNLIGTASEPAEYIITYLDHYSHNDTDRMAMNVDQLALGTFAQGNTHLIFQSNLIDEEDTSHTNRFLLTASEFELPKDNPDITTDDNISVTFRNLNITAEDVVINGSELTIEEENNISIDNLRAVLKIDSDTNVGTFIDVQGYHSIGNIELDSVHYGPELYLGSLDEYNIAYTFLNLTGSNYVEVGKNVDLDITNELILPYLETPGDINKNGHLILKGNNNLYLKGDSVTNTIGNLVVEEVAELTFTESFDTSVEAPLKIANNAIISEYGLRVEIDGAYLENLQWIGKDVIAFSALDKLVENDYWSTRLFYDVDEETCALQVWDFRSMKIEVTFPNRTTIKFPSYEEALEWIQYNYTIVSSVKTYTIALIDHYERLGLGGDGLESNDNIALQKFYKEDVILNFTSTIDEDTGEYYTFKRFTDDNNEDEEVYGGDNDTFALPASILDKNMTVNLYNIDFSFVENIYAGNITLNLYETIKSDNPITYYGTYDMTEEAGVNQSELVMVESNTIGLSRDGTPEGIGIIGFNKVNAERLSILYVNQVKKVDNCAALFYRGFGSYIYYQEAGIYEWGTIDYSSNSLRTIFNHVEAIVYSYGEGIIQNVSNRSELLYFDQAKNAVNRDVYVFFTADGTPAPSYANQSYHTLSGDAANAVSLEVRDNIVYTKTNIAVVAPDGTDEGGDEIDNISYYNTLADAMEGIEAHTRTGEFEIVFIEDYAVLETDNSALMAFSREDVKLNFQSKFREDVCIEHIRYDGTDDVKTEDIGIIASVWKNIVEFFVGDSDETTMAEEGEESDPYEGYSKVTLEAESSYNYEVLELPATGATPSYFNDIVFDLAVNSRAILIRGGGGGVTMDSNVRATNGLIDVSGYSHETTGYYTRTGQDPYVRILGGTYRNVYGVREESSYVGSTTSATELVPKVYLEGGVVKQLHGGSYYGTYYRPTEIHISGGIVTDLLTVSNAITTGTPVASDEQIGKLFIHEDTVLPKTRNFDRITISKNVTVIMNGVLDAYYSTTTSDFTYNRLKSGIIEFSENSQLQLYEVPAGTAGDTDGVNSVGRLVTTGTGASLIVPKMGNGMESLRIDTAYLYSTTDVSGGLLTISPKPGFEYSPPQYDENNELIPEEDDNSNRFVVGDNIIYFPTGKVNGGDTLSYNNGFLPLGMIGDSSTGYISLEAMPITMAKNDGEHIYYPSIESACDAIDNDGEFANDIDYTFIIREEGYTISALDESALTKYGINAKSITFSSAFVLTDRDTLLYGEKSGDTVRRIVNMERNLTCYTDVYFDNILIYTATDDINISANGHGLYMGTNTAPYLPKDVSYAGVEMVGSNFPNIYGGSRINKTEVEETHVELGSGNYNNVYGGSYNGRVLGNTYLQLGNEPTMQGFSVSALTITGDVYGGGNAYSSTANYGSVGGDTNLVIYGATFEKEDLAIIGGGAGYYRSIVTGQANISIYNLSAPKSDVSIIGTETANTGDVYIEVVEGGDVKALSASIYGVRGEKSIVATSTGTIIGDLEVRIHGGQGLTSIEGWAYARSYSSSTADNQRIDGEINIFMGAGGSGGGVGSANALVAELDYIDQFDNLYIGYNDQISNEEGVVDINTSSGAAHITINSFICGVPNSNKENNYRYGTIHMMEGSSLTLPSTGTVATKDLKVDESLPHLYIGKADKDGDTNPLIISGNNLSGNVMGESDEETKLLNRLIVSVQSKEHNSLVDGELAEVGDDLIRFEEFPDNARDYDYVSGVDKFDIKLSSTEEGVIEFGASSIPIVTQTLVEHKDANGNVTEPATGMNSSISTNLGSSLNKVMKTLYFSIENEDEDGNYSGYKIDSGYISNTYEVDTEWQEGGVVPSNLSEIIITETETTGLWQGKVSLDIESYGISQMSYYAHVRDERGAVKVILLDVHSPIYTNEPLVEQVNGGDYHITLTMTDPTYQDMNEDVSGEVFPYNPSGIYQGAYTIGTTESCPGQDEILENRTISISDNVKDVIDAQSNTTNFTGTAIVPKELLSNINVDMNDVVIYMYLKDNLGNTRQVAIPMSEYMIDVTVPTRIGMIAIEGSSDRLLAPECYVINNGNNTVKAEVVEINIANDNSLTFVIDKENLGKNKMWLVITSDGSPQQYDYLLNFSYIPVQYLNSGSMPNGLHIGTMSPAVENKNAAYYTFAALYNAGDLDVTSGWDLFTMNYRFTVMSQ